MSLPSLTHLQFLVLGVVVATAKPGRRIREALLDHDLRTSGPAFYQLMARLEEAGYVRGWYEQKQIEEQIVKERWYEITADGLSAWHRTRDFYVEASLGTDHGGQRV